jgi:hypothetical protein
MSCLRCRYGLLVAEPPAFEVTVTDTGLLGQTIFKPYLLFEP